MTPPSARQMQLLRGDPSLHPAPATISLIAPEPPKLSRHLEELIALEESGVFSNYGPVNCTLEQELIEQVFEQGHCVTVCNATIGLMLAIREVLPIPSLSVRRYALMPSFTFAAAAQAAIWCGLIPLLCDIDRQTWMPDPQEEQRLLHRYRGQIAVVIPYATFGNNLDLAYYQRLSEEHDVPIVVDAASSMGSLDAQGKAFGAGFAWPVVFSMHATKVFAVGEGGFIYSADPHRIERLRQMGSFGFAQGRSASMIGLNSKLSEIAALMARLQLRDYRWTLARRELVARRYLDELGAEFLTQRQAGTRQARSFQSVLLPRELAPARNRAIDLLRSEGVGAGSYFSPHLAEQPLFQQSASCAKLVVTQDVASRIISLPLTTGMQPEQVSLVVRTLEQVTAGLQRKSRSHRQPGTLREVGSGNSRLRSTVSA